MLWPTWYQTVNSFAHKDTVDFSGSPFPDREVTGADRIRSISRFLKFFHLVPMSGVKGGFLPMKINPVSSYAYPTSSTQPPRPASSVSVSLPKQQQAKAQDSSLPKDTATLSSQAKSKSKDVDHDGDSH